MAKQIQKESLLPPLWVVALLVLALFVYLLLELREIVILLVVGYSSAYVINPLLEWFERRRVPRPFGFALIVVGLVLVLVVLTLTALPTLTREYRILVANFPGYLETVQSKVNLWLESEQAGLFTAVATTWNDLSQDLLSQFGGDGAKSIVAGLSKALLRGYSITLTIINLLLLPFIIYYLAVSFPQMHSWALRLFPVGMQKKVRQIALEIDGCLTAFIHGQALVGVVLSVFYAFGFGIIGVELWFLLALISGFGDLIPYMGLLIGVVLTSIMTLVTFGDLTHLLMVWGVFLVAQIVVSSFIAPKLLGDKVGLSPLVVLIALLAGGKLFGLLGIFLAVPVVAALAVLLRYSHAWLIKRTA